jgi:hypothetical protein
MGEIEEVAKQMGLTLPKEDIKKISKHELDGVGSPHAKKLHAIKKKARKLKAKMHRLNPNKKV